MKHLVIHFTSSIPSKSCASYTKIQQISVLQIPEESPSKVRGRLTEQVMIFNFKGG